MPPETVVTLLLVATDVDLLEASQSLLFSVAVLPELVDRPCTGSSPRK